MINEIEIIVGNDHTYLFIIAWLVLVGLGAILFGFLLHWFRKKLNINVDSPIVGIIKRKALMLINQCIKGD